MGSCNTKPKAAAQKEPDGLFEREKWKQGKREERRQKPTSKKKRVGVTDAPVTPGVLAAPPVPRPAPNPNRSYDEEALERMRHQLNTDSDAFLLNNILLSVQFFENYEREIHHLKNNPSCDWDIQINEQMVKHNKHVFLADRLQESVYEHVRFKRTEADTNSNNQSGLEPLSPLRMFVIYDNIEASEPGDTSDYSAVLDTPFYKLLMEDTKEPGYVHLKKIEVLQNASNEQADKVSKKSENSEYTDSEKESDSSDDSYPAQSKGEALLIKLKSKLENGSIGKQQMQSTNSHKKIITEEPNIERYDVYGRRPSGPIRQMSSVASKASLSNFNIIKEANRSLNEENDVEKMVSGITKADIDRFNLLQEKEISENKRKKPTFKTTNRRPSGPTRQTYGNVTQKLHQGNVEDISITEETESSGYRSNSNSSPQNGSDSDYGYATITKLTTPQPLVLSSKVNMFESTGVVPDSCWAPIKVKVTEHWNDDDGDDDEFEDNDNINYLKDKLLYETKYYLSSVGFMSNFVDIFMTKLGKSLGFSSEAIGKAMTQGASIYCDTLKYNVHLRYEIVPAVIAAWSSCANEWIIRTRRTIRNPKTNFAYQWPTKYMVNKARGLGCLLVPVGYRPKKGINPDQEMQWRIIFPAAERYLETCLAHSQVRCYMFTLALVKTFMENDKYKIGLDASHIKNHLFSRCEDNYAMWPEDRLGETLRIFLKSLYGHFTQAKFPDYFIETHDHFKNLPRTMLLKLQRKLADIIENPVMHVLCTIQNLKYTSGDFYPQFNYMRLYRILTTKNILRLINPNFRFVSQDQDAHSSDSEDEYKENQIGLWEKAKSKDKYYQWKKEQQRQVQARRRAAIKADKKVKKEAAKRAQVIDKSILLPKKMDLERRRLVLEFFIPHFISMANQSDKFEATKQAIIYLEHSQRLCLLLREEPGGEESADEFLDTIKSKLNECKLKLVEHSALKLPKRNESVMLHNFSRTRPHPANIAKLRSEYVNLSNQDSPPPPSPVLGANTFSFVQEHTEENTYKSGLTLKFKKDDDSDSEQDSKL